MQVETLKWFHFHVLSVLVLWQVNISLVVNDSEAEQCVRALHLAFFESELSELEMDYKNGNGSVHELSLGDT